MSESLDILVISDQNKLADICRDSIGDNLPVGTFEMKSDYHEIITLICQNKYNLYLVDEMIYNGGGRQIIRTARDMRCSGAMILVNHAEADNKSVLDSGASAYIRISHLENNLVSIIRQAMYINSVIQRDRDSEDFMRVLFQSQSAGILLVDDELTIINSNNFTRHITGRYCPDIIGKKLGEILCCPAGVEKEMSCTGCCTKTSCGFSSQIEESLNKETIIHKEMELHFPGSGTVSKMWASVAVKPVYVSGRHYAVVIIDDLTEKHELEKQLERAMEKSEQDSSRLEELNRQLQLVISQTNSMVQEAFAASKAKNDFMANISHELRTPLNGIQGFCQLLMEENVTQEQAEYVETIYNCSKDLSKVLNNVLEFTKLEKNNVDVVRQWFSTEDILDEIIIIFKDIAEKKGLEFCIRKSKNCPHEIKSDQGKLKQSLFNVIDNAVKYTNSGTIDIFVYENNVLGEDHIAFDVSDSGIGMSQNEVTRVFESFNQADSSLTRKYDGLGLGLSVAKRYIELLGGHIGLESSEGEGSRFTVSIPVDKKIKKVRLSDMDRDSRNAKNVLIVEGNPNHAEILKEYVSRLKVDYVHVSDALDVADAVAGSRYAYILLDLNMSIVREGSVMDIIYEASHFTPVYGVTMQFDNNIKNLSRKLGCKGLLTKPVEKSELDKLTVKYCSVPEDLLEETLDMEAEDFFSKRSDSIVEAYDDDGSGSFGFAVKKSKCKQMNTSTLDDDPEMQEVIQCFISMIPDYLGKIDHAVEQDNMAELGRILFELRDSAGGAGYSEFRLNILNIEKAASEKHFDLVKKMLEQLKECASYLVANHGVAAVGG